jgi:hypothetical protein
MKGLWIRTSVKVDLTKEDKVTIGKPTSPRWELDIVVYSGGDNILYIEPLAKFPNPQVKIVIFSFGRTF